MRECFENVTQIQYIEEFLWTKSWSISDLTLLHTTATKMHNKNQLFFSFSFAAISLILYFSLLWCMFAHSKDQLPFFYAFCWFRYRETFIYINLCFASNNNSNNKKCIADYQLEHQQFKRNYKAFHGIWYITCFLWKMFSIKFTVGIG